MHHCTCDFGPCAFVIEVDDDDGTEHLYVFYHEEDNVFTDENGQIYCNLNYIITPHQRWMFRNDPWTYSEFPCLIDPNIRVHMAWVPKGHICDVTAEDARELVKRYEKFEQEEWKHFAYVGG